MKNTIKTIQLRLSLIACLLLPALYSLAQDSATSSESHTTTTNSTSVTAPDTSAMWYTAPWVWVAGVVVLILILFAIFRGNNSSKSEVIRTTKTTTEVKND